MTNIPVRCPEGDCGGIVYVPKSLHDDHDVLVGLTCPRGHRFDYEKLICPRCGSPAEPASHDIVRTAFSTGAFPEGRQFKPAECTSLDCD